MKRVVTREMRRQLERDNLKFSDVMVEIPRAEWPTIPVPVTMPIEVWRSRRFLAQVFIEGKGVVRLSICITQVATDSNHWEEGITWEELQKIKREVGRGDLDAVEVYPSDKDIVNVPNMRHLFVFDTPLTYKWTKQ